MSTSGRELLAYERNQPAVVRSEPASAPPAPPTRRSRPWLAVVVFLAALALVAGGMALGALARSDAVDHQNPRALRAERQLASVRDQLAGKQATIDSQQHQLAHVQRQLEQQRTTPTTQPAPVAADAATTFGDGLYQVGLAIQPGRYETGGAADCYWAKLSTGDTNKVITNNIAAGPQTVTIDSPYFESEACGTWTKVG
jgi:hypothetical protein